MNIIILTNGNSFCTRILNESKHLKQFKKLKIYIEVPLKLNHFKLKNEKLNLILILKLIYRCFKHFKFLFFFIKDNRSYWRQFVFIRDIKNKKTIGYFKSQKIDVIFLAGMSILKKEIIDSAKIGVYNCHPAIIPNVRGLDVIYHSVINLIPPIISIHRVDKGIDTGNLIQAFKVPNKLINKISSYNKVNNNILDFASHKFVEFINYFTINLKEEEVFFCTDNFPILPYCKQIVKKDLNLFFTCLNKCIESSGNLNKIKKH